MAGHRRTKAKAKSLPGEPIELQRRVRFDNRRAALVEKLAAAQSPAQQVAAAAAYLRSALEVVPPELAQSAASEAVDDLIRRTDDLFRANLRRNK